MYTSDTDFSISPRTAIYTTDYLTIPIGNNLNNLNIPQSPLSPISLSPVSISSFSLSPVFSPLPSPASPVSPISSISSPFTSPDISEGEDFPMDRLDYIKNQLNMFPPPITAIQFIEKNSFEGADGRIKRPSNNFILFRKIAHDQKNQSQALSHYNEREWSQIIGKIWKSLSSEEVNTYKLLGEDVARIHKDLYPDYKYQPKRDKAAWKHYTVQTVTKKKSKVKGGKPKQPKQQKQERQEKQLEIITDFQQQQQQQQLLPSNTLSYSLPPESQVVSNVSTISTDGFSFGYPDPVESVFNENLNNFMMEMPSWMNTAVNSGYSEPLFNNGTI